MNTEQNGVERVGTHRLTMVLFMACFVVAQADKQIMSLLAVPVQQALDLTDTQLGMLQGLAFALTYAVAGLPIARWLDQGHRVRIAALCVVTWSVATVLCGVAGSFAAIALFRALTAFAEAGIAPAALSVLSQTANRKSIARASSLFMSAPYIGGGLALAGGGLAMRVVSEHGLTIGAWSDPWRMVFLLIGAPGILLALLLVRLGHEPARLPATGSSGDGAMPSLLDILRTIFVRSPSLRFYYLGLMTFSIFLYGTTAWFTVLIVRVQGLSIATAGAYSGGIFMIAGLSGTLLAGVLSTRRKDDSVKGLVRGFAVIAAALVPVGALLSIAPALPITLALYGAFALLSAMIVSLMVVPIQLVMPNRMQARSIAVCVFLNAAISGSVGPLAIGMLSDRAMSLALAMSLTSVASMSISAVLLWHAARTWDDGRIR